MGQLSTTQKLISLDATLTYLARQREAAADDVAKAATIDAQWSDFDNQRKNIIARASDKELVDYELAREKWRQQATA